MNNAEIFLNLPPQEFVDFLKDQHIARFYFVYDPKRDAMINSHPQLQPIADFIHADKRDFMLHEGLFFQITQEYDTLQGAFVLRLRRHFHRNDSESFDA